MEIAEACGIKFSADEKTKTFNKVSGLFDFGRLNDVKISNM